MKVGIIQQANGKDRNQNIEKLTQNIRSVAKKGAELVVLQELHNGLYFCQTEDVNVFNQAEEIPGFSTDYFGKLAKELGVVMVLSLFEKRAKGLYHNTAVVLEKDGTIAGKYRKMHIPDDPAYYEKFYFTEGDLGFEPIKTSVGTLGVLVCLGPMVSRSSTVDGNGRSRHFDLSNCYRLGKYRHQARKIQSARSVDNHSAFAFGSKRYSCYLL